MGNSPIIFPLKILLLLPIVVFGYIITLSPIKLLSPIQTFLWIIAESEILLLIPKVVFFLPFVYY